MVGIGVGLGIGLMALVKTLAIGGVVVAVIAILTWERIKRWFQERQSTCERDEDNVAFSYIEKIQTDEYKTVYGIFNKKTATMVESETIKSNSIDETLRRYHEKEPLVVYK